MKSLTEAVREKYSDDEDGDLENCGIVLYVPRSQQRQRLPSVLILDHCGICNIGNEEHLGTTCGQVRELDVAHNHLTSWDEVRKMLCSLPNLTFLNLSHNSLKGDLSLHRDKSFVTLKQLILNNVGIDWSKMNVLLQQAPNVEELHLSFNEMKTPSHGQEDFTYAKIRKLHYDGNYVEHADHLFWLSQAFPSLEILQLTKCGLWTLRWGQQSPESLKGKARAQFSPVGSSYETSTQNSQDCPGDGQCKTCCNPGDSPEVAMKAVFQKLRSVNLNHCLIDCWEELEQLRSWPSLVDLRLQSCPLFHKLTEHERRQSTIARLPHIRILNGGSEISSDEREKAERNFVRSFRDSPARPRRYDELVGLHGEVAPLASVSFRPPRSVSVWFTYGERRWKEDVSVYLTVKELKTRVGAAIGVPSPQLRIFYVDVCAELLRFPSKQLYSYNIHDDDEFIVDIKN